jgi:hypothetical protein
MSAPLIVAPPDLIAEYGLQVWQPSCHATFIDPAGAVVSTVEVLSGDLRSDAGVWPRTDCTLTVAAALTPAATAPPVSPYGGSVRLTNTVQVGTRRWSYTVATLDVTETTIDRPSAVLEVRAVSSEARVNEDRYYTRTTVGGGLASAVVTGIVRRTLPTVPVINLLTQDLPVAVDRVPLDGDVWPAVEAVMTATNGEAVFNADGALVLRDTPVRDTPAALRLVTGETGQRGATLTGYRSTRGWAPNKVVQLYQELQDNGPRRTGIWEDTGPIAGTGTGYGRHTEITRTSVDTGQLPPQSTADRAALALAKRHRGAFRSVELRCIPAPWISPGDTVQVVLLGGLSETLLVTAVTWPLDQLDVMVIQAVDPDYTAT